MTTAIVAEKPAVARDLARVLGARRRGQGLLEGSGYVVTWALGHLVHLPEPHQIRPAWKRWREEDLPLLPTEWPLQVAERTRDQFQVVRRVLLAGDVDEVICATDAGREGELIFRYLYEAAGCTKPVRRLWISSLTPAAIRRGLESLKPARDFDHLAAAARGRSRADWLVGMNLSRACTLRHARDGESLSVGRVQTPTLAMVVERELAIRDFVAEDYLEVVARFSLPGGGDGDDGDGGAAGGDRTSYDGRYVARRGDRTAKRFSLAGDGAEAARQEAERVAERARTGRAQIEEVATRVRREPPPLLYDLTELQRQANRLFGWSARRTLGVAQRLYEERKLITYPRTDSRHLPSDVAANLPAIVAAIRAPYDGLLAPGTGTRPLGSRFVADGRVTDHHAIIPTGTPLPAAVKGDERRLFDLICRRLLAAWQEEHRSAQTKVLTLIRNATAEGEGKSEDPYLSTGTVVEEAGWKRLEPTPARRRSRSRAEGEPEVPPPSLPPGLVEGLAVTVREARTEQKTTRPPKRLTDATLLSAMETAGKTLDDRELSEAMRERGLGTPATRAEIIETLVRREYVVRRGRALAATEKGIRLIGLVDPRVKSPVMTGEWEAELKRIERGEADAVAFERRIECFVQEVVASTLVAERGARPAVAHQVQGSLFGVEAESSGGHPPAPGDAPAERAAAPGRGSPDGGVKERETGRRGPPREQASSIAPSARRSRATAASPSRPRGADLPALLAGVFGHPAFRPLQEEVAQQVVAGRDVLLVMPTGAGKSLCYQLPGLARGGTTLVVSPLIALMEDQVAKLQELGVRAERIHSGRGARESRRVYSAYVAEALEFLYVAPERLGVSGFPELLARRPPSLVAIDEAHCISHWGHDFRPDYRLLGERLPQLRPAPVVALTATATPRVQQDIVDQLGLRDAHRFIHGFRRSNIAIELAEVRPSGRAGIVDRVLADSERRPAIVYAPSRKETERLAGRLGERMSAAAYHAGMTPRSRDRVQERFLTGDVEVMVATIAFGMGVDKPDIRTVVHTGLPGSVEGYYQEIGRAGRDGNPSRALLLYSWADRRMHEFFHGRDYPDPAELDVVARKLAVEPEPLESLRRRTPLDDDTFDKALEKLWIHGGARIAPDPESMQETVARAEGEWRRPYVEQRQWRLEQLEEITRFTGGHGCRMVELVRHFGDQNDDGSRCGVCDVCVPDETVAHEQRRPTGDEIAVMETVLEHLGRRDGLATGRLYRQVKEIHGSVERGELEDLLHGLASARLVDVRRDSFTKGAERIHYQRVCLTRTARRQGREALADVRLTVTAGEPAAGGGATRRTRRRRATAPPEREASPGLVAALKEWRLAESRRRRVPAFRILTNRALEALAAAAPGNEEELLAVHGIGPAVARQYGRELLRLVRDAPRGATP